MEQQGPWMANYIEDLAPRMNRWHVTDEQWNREKNFAKLQPGMTPDEVQSILGPPIQNLLTKIQNELAWDAGIKTIHVTFNDNKLASKAMTLLPAEARRKLTQWAAAPFPTTNPSDRNVGFVDFDAMIIPRTAKHKKEAFEFIAFINRQDVSEALNSMHCKNSPLNKVSEQFIANHPNPYIQVFEDCARNPKSFAEPQTPIWPEIADEMTVAGQKCYLLEQSAAAAMKAAQERLKAHADYFAKIQRERAEGKAQQ
jgi:ABC-type glycerol-3-phosphate transport system substrate-binding protein